jgi:hypothetical protein
VKGAAGIPAAFFAFTAESSMTKKILPLALLGACSEKAPKAADPAPVAEPATVAAPAVQPVQPTSKLLGQWNGPEGTYLLVAGTSGKYAITIADLDGPRTFQGNGLGDTIEFERDGKRHTLRATDGAATGMKWLSDKKNCVTVEAGEGFCRD